mmetsp:Transcript_60744/g.89028  ORF Transcript_60744/g.89028 Transcript_60744/m.89028 type:complete len:234 (+) Transcript_60744:197-898(+)
MRASGERFAASFILLACIGPSTGFVPMGRISVELRQPDAVSICAAVGTRPKPGMRSRINIRQPSARTSVAVQALPGEKKEVISEALRKSVVVEAAMEHCFQVASDLDSYTKWCSKGGMKKVIVMERNEDNLASKVQLTAGKLGVDMLNVMEYSYISPSEVSFNSIEGDVMKKLEGRYMFAAVANEPSKTEVTYELDLEFGFPLPGMVRTQICGAIMRTALNAFKTYAETGQGP